MLKIIDNFSGRLSRQNIGELNSGLAKYATSFGYDPFSNPSNLTWLENPIAINNPDGVGNGSLCMAAKTRLESGITYVYAVFDNLRLTKIKVNDPSTHNPNYDVASKIADLFINTPAFSYGSSLQFYGATEKIFIGHDKGITKINFDGSAETFVGVLGSYTQNVPRPSANFLGKMYFGNGSNLVEIDSTETVTSYAKLSPGFPTGTYVRDLDVSPDGNYLQIILSRINSPSLDQIDQDTNSLSSTDSYKFLWNGTDTGYTSYESYNGYSLTSNTVFGPFNYTMGYDLGGAALYSGSEKILSLPTTTSPNFGAMFSTGNLLGFASPEYTTDTTYTASRMTGSIMFYGQYDQEVPRGLFRFCRINNGPNDNEVANLPLCLTVTNLFYGPVHSIYNGNLVGSAKLYFSVLECQTGGSSTFYKFYKFTTVPTGLGTAMTGVWESQQETSFKLFRSIISKKFKVNSFRFYTEPLVANNSFQIDLIGSNGQPMNGGTQVFTVGSNVTAGDDIVEFTPAHAPTYSVGIRVTNLGTVNWTGVKMELEYEEEGVR